MLGGQGPPQVILGIEMDQRDARQVPYHLYYLSSHKTDVQSTLSYTLETN